MTVPFSTYVARHGLPLVFANVLAEQLGLPIPAMPTLIVAGALAIERDFRASLALLLAVVASVIADAIWFLLGRRNGFRILKILCKVSLSPDSCVRETTRLFDKWGMPSLLVAKFVPGFSTVAPPLAGAVGAPFHVFLVFDAGGALLWAGAGIGAGMVFHSAVDRVLGSLTSLGNWGLVILGAALLAFIFWKWWQRRKFYEALRMARMSVADLNHLFEEGAKPLVLDVRTDVARRADPRRIPGARSLTFDDLSERIEDLPLDRDIILYCT
jgi:membrane protein DedA with SNARE-associated domain